MEETIETVKEKAQRLLHERFGFATFRQGQWETIEAVLTCKRVLCIQPTGYGKSLLYQLTTCLLGGMTIVISPLLALMRDQIGQLRTRFGIAAASINSDQTPADNAEACRAAAQGQLSVLFVAPEQLDNIGQFEFLLSLPVNLLVVDEAHCLSTWGHDFRPSYRQILHYVHAMEQKNARLRLLGLTATADDKTEKEIKKLLTSSPEGMHVIRASMHRHNLHLNVLRVNGLAEKLALCERLLRQLEGCGLIYCATRENSELVGDYLKRTGHAAEYYHAGIDAAMKYKLQHDFLRDTYKALAATNALGMGIDKPNLRYIIHFDMPGSTTAYYQEVGRAGRDGLPAEGFLLYDPADSRIQEYFIESAFPSGDDFDKILKAVKEAAAPPNLTALRRASGLHPTRVNVVIAELVEQNWLRKEMNGRSQVYLPGAGTNRLDLSRYTNQLESKNKQLNSMVHYSIQKGLCRMSLLKNSLGDNDNAACSHCDICCRKEINMMPPPAQVQTIKRWLEERPVIVPESKIHEISQGVCLFDGKLRAPLFVSFMQKRAQQNLEVEEALLHAIATQVKALTKKGTFAAVLLLPSKSWAQRVAVGKFIADTLGCPLLDNVLYWIEEPRVRQGTLLNNDQRRDNVAKKMAAKALPLLPKGDILIVDDYIGSASTIKEAGRSLRSAGVRRERRIVPFAIAMVKWRIGRPGFV